jgi:hypothetical protein
MTKDELILKRDEKIADLKEKVAELEEVIYEYEENDMGVLVSETEKKMLRIISEQIERLGKLSDVQTLDKDDCKLFDTYVKDIVAIRGKMPTPKTQKDEATEESEAELLELIKANTK